MRKPLFLLTGVVMAIARAANTIGHRPKTPFWTWNERHMGLALEGSQQLREGPEKDAKTISYTMVFEGQSDKEAKRTSQMMPGV